jgi:uncharacterized membrane protein YcjF (UPF0283 family)
LSALRTGGKEIAAVAVNVGAWANDVNERASRLSRAIAEARVSFALLTLGVTFQAVAVIGELDGFEEWRTYVLGAVLVLVLAPAAAFAVRKETKRLYDVARVRSYQERAADRARS